jgi:hypothetical protein
LDPRIIPQRRKRTEAHPHEESHEMNAKSATVLSASGGIAAKVADFRLVVVDNFHFGEPAPMPGTAIARR